MNDKEFDIVLKNVLKPDILPGDELNQMLLDRVHGSTHTDNKSSDTRKKSRNTVNYLLRAAAIALVVSCIGGIGVYAANYILKKTTVYEHGISVGNQEYNNDEALTEPAEEVTEIKEGTFKGGPDDKWFTKNVLITGGAYRNTYYDYSDYETAVDDIDFNSLFSESIGKAVSICYVETEENTETPLTVIEYISMDLKQDELQFHNPLHRKILAEAEAHLHDSNFTAERYFLAHPDPTISKLAADMINDRYQLSKSNSQAMIKDEERLHELVPHQLIDFKLAILEEDMKYTLQALNNPEVVANADKCLEVMAHFKELSELQKIMAKRAGDRVVLK